MNWLKIMGIGLVVWMVWAIAKGPDEEFFADVAAVQTVNTALKPANVTFAPQVHRRAPDGAIIVGGIATARGRDLAYQLRVERICGAAEASCYRPHLVYLGPPPGEPTGAVVRPRAASGAPQSPESKHRPN
jgi:hypothetical protein